VTIHEYVVRARRQLRSAGVPDEEAALDARLLAQRVLGWDAARLLTSDGEEASGEFPAGYTTLVLRRAKREPMAYILGSQEFWDLTFEVTPAVLVPRPETEIIVEAALELFPDPAAILRIADIGTGSGCLAVSLAHERPNARLVAVDLSGDALDVACANAIRHGVADRVTFVAADLLTGSLLERFTFDLIVSNPPYVPVSDRPALPPEVRDHEPPGALFAGADGLDIIRQIAAQAVPRLNPGGVLMCEIGFGQAEAVRELISSTQGLTMVGLRNDLQGVPRTVITRRDM
jgi:release factor glutamine methyltransferase